MDIKKELEKSKTVLLIIPGVEYNDVLIDTVKKLSGKKIGYVTLNKTFDSLKEILLKNKVNVDAITFVDAISKTIKQVPDQTEECYFVSSPGALTELSIVISELIKQNFDYIIFDSLTNLLIYQDEAPVAKFVSHIINRIKETNSKAVFYALRLGEQEELIQKSEMFVDSVVELELEPKKGKKPNPK